jgi:hypothetical protein
MKLMVSLEGKTTSNGMNDLDSAVREKLASMANIEDPIIRMFIAYVLNIRINFADLGMQPPDFEIADLCVAPDGWLLLRCAGDTDWSYFVNKEAELPQNWENLLNAGHLTTEERRAAEAHYEQVVRRCPESANPRFRA